MEEAPVTPSATFTPSERIRRREDFQRIYQQGARVSGRFGTFFFYPHAAGPARLGIAATRKLGGAVQRNLAKRLIREVFRRNKQTRGLDVVVVPKPSLLTAESGAFETEYRRHLDRYTHR